MVLPRDRVTEPWILMNEEILMNDLKENPRKRLWKKQDVQLYIHYDPVLA